ncbi:MAG: hypothetical protein ACOC56_01715 [Atribacterota bacterium]
MSRGVKIIIVFAVTTILFVITLWLLVPLFNFYIVKKVFNYVVQNFVNVTGMSTWLVKGIVIFLLIPFVWAILEITKFNIRLFKRKKSYRKVGILVIVSYIGLFFLLMFFLSRGTYFGHEEGEVIKYYAITPEGIRFFDSPGFDPRYGIKLKPVTPKIAENYEKAKKGLRPKRIDISKGIEFFDSITGKPKVWYYKDNEGNYEFFDQPGFHPIYWTELKPVSREIVLDYKKKVKQKEEERRIEKEKKRRQEKIAMKKAYIKNHINPIITNNPSGIEIAVLMAEKETMESSPSTIVIGQKIVEELTKENIKAVSNLFSNRFFVEGNFEDLFKGDPKVIFELGIKNNVDYLILGTKEDVFSQNPRLGDLISCNLYLYLKVYDTNSGEIVSSSSFEEKGVGIDADKAELQALYRIVKKVESFIFNKI